MNLFLVIISFAAIAAIELPGMVKKKQWRDVVLYSIVFVPVLALAVLMAFDMKIPSPIKAIQTFYRDVLGLSFKIAE